MRKKETKREWEWGVGGLTSETAYQPLLPLPSRAVMSTWFGAPAEFPGHGREFPAGEDSGLRGQASSCAWAGGEPPSGC